MATVSGKVTKVVMLSGSSNRNLVADALAAGAQGFVGKPLVWIPHSYNGCKQHGPNEHFLIAPAREGLAAYTGIWWDLGEAGVP